jgi:hypothetical protein
MMRDPRPVAGHPDYLVDATGSVFSTRRKGRMPKNGQPKPACRRLRSRPNHDGYLVIDVVDKNDARARSLLVHRLVCAAFHGPPPTSAHEAQHRDGTRTNNAEANLKWGLPKENAEDRELHGRTPRGSRNGCAKLDEAGVAEIRARVQGGELQKDIAAELGLSKSAISHVITRRNWRTA